MSPFRRIQPSALEQNERRAMLYVRFTLSETQQQSYVIQPQGAPQLLTSYYWTYVTSNSLTLHSPRALSKPTQLLSSYCWTCVTNNSLMLHSFRVLSYPSQHLTSYYWTCVTTTAGCCNVLQSNPELVKGKLTGSTSFRQEQTSFVKNIPFTGSIVRQKQCNLYRDYSFSD